MDEPATDGPALTATAPVALRWRVVRDGSGTGGQVQAEAAAVASARALAACLEAEGSRGADARPDRLEAKLDLLLLKVDRLAALLHPAGSGDRADFLGCEARFTADWVEWAEPLPLPPDGTHVLLEVRALPAQPVEICLPATLSRVAEPAPGGPAPLRVRALLADLPQPARDAYERCVFILHRMMVRQSQGMPRRG